MEISQQLLKKRPVTLLKRLLCLFSNNFKLFKRQECIFFITEHSRSLFINPVIMITSMWNWLSLFLGKDSQKRDVSKQSRGFSLLRWELLFQLKQWNWCRKSEYQMFPSFQRKSCCPARCASNKATCVCVTCVPVWTSSPALSSHVPSVTKQLHFPLKPRHSLEFQHLFPCLHIFKLHPFHTTLFWH